MSVTDHKWLDTACNEEGCQSLVLKDEIAHLRTDNERLRERLGPRGLEVVEIDGAGHYVNAKVKDEITRLRTREKTLENTARINLAGALRMKAERDTLLAAAREVERWWIEQEMAQHTGAPAAIFMIRKAVRISNDADEIAGFRNV